MNYLCLIAFHHELLQDISCTVHVSVHCEFVFWTKIHFFVATKLLVNEATLTTGLAGVCFIDDIDCHPRVLSDYFQESLAKKVVFPCVELLDSFGAYVSAIPFDNFFCSKIRKKNYHVFHTNLLDNLAMHILLKVSSNPIVCCRQCLLPDVIPCFVTCRMVSGNFLKAVNQLFLDLFELSNVFVTIDKDTSIQQIYGKKFRFSWVN